MSKSIVELVDELPTDNITVKALEALDYVSPGNWKNLVGFNKTIRVLTNETDKNAIEKIRDRAAEIYENKDNGYQTAVWLYQSVDKIDQAVATAAIANKVGDTFRFIPLLDKLTPKSDTVQTVDFSIKLLAEVIAYCQTHKLKANPAEFAELVVKSYQGPALMRMTGLVCFDGLFPLGPDFLSIISSHIQKGDLSALDSNPQAQSMNDLIPSADKKAFVSETFANLQDWLTQMAGTVGTNIPSLAHKMSGFIEVADDKLDYLAAFLDGTVNYFEHTGIQTVAKRIIKVAHREVM